MQTVKNIHIAYCFQWKLLFADDLVLMAESEDKLRQKMLSSKPALVGITSYKGLKVNVNRKTVMLGRSAVSMQWDTLISLCSVTMYAVKV